MWMQWNATRACCARNGPRRETSDVRSHARLPNRSLSSDKPDSCTKPNKPFPWNSHKNTAPVKKMTNTKQKSQWIRRERKIRMAPILGRLGAGAVFTTFIMIAFCSATLIGLSWGWELAQRDGRVGFFPRLAASLESSPAQSPAPADGNQQSLALKYSTNYAWTEASRHPTWIRSWMTKRSRFILGCATTCSCGHNNDRPI